MTIETIAHVQYAYVRRLFCRAIIRIYCCVLTFRMILALGNKIEFLTILILRRILVALYIEHIKHIEQISQKNKLV